MGLWCFVGIGNTSEKDKQGKTECHGVVVCKKMYGGGMGDQIKRYCDDVEPEVITLSYSLNFGIFSFSKRQTLGRLLGQLYNWFQSYFFT